MPVFVERRRLKFTFAGQKRSPIPTIIVEKISQRYNGFCKKTTAIYRNAGCTIGSTKRTPGYLTIVDGDDA